MKTVFRVFFINLNISSFPTNHLLLPSYFRAQKPDIKIEIIALPLTTTLSIYKFTQPRTSYISFFSKCPYSVGELKLNIFFMSLKNSSLNTFNFNFFEATSTFRTSTKCNEIVIKTKVKLRGREHLQENPMSHSAHDNKFISLSLCFSGFYFFPYTATTPVSVRYDGMLYICLCFLVSCNKFHLIFAHKIRRILACTEFFFPLVRIWEMFTSYRVCACTTECLLMHF